MAEAKVFDFQLSRIHCPGELPALDGDLRQVALTTAEFIESSRSAQKWAVTVGWSRAIGKSPGFDRSVVGALERSLDQSVARIDQIDGCLLRLRAAALEIAASGPARSRRPAAVFAQYLDYARRYLRPVYVDLDLSAAAAGRFLAALVAGLDRQLATDGACTPPGGLSRRMLAAAAALLPAHCRDRYSEEFISEISDMPRRQHFGYVLRILWNSLELRSAVGTLMKTIDRRPLP
ncbi:hypothetical protein [Pseudonocardia hierapolitana]|uniref:hypothetical protein n=1 Tax=Pseudonocardia hierapolitana TaxID=1128676 RepID=UPI0011BD7655|nr:hypothetical protein [Pseudonocardia hierapolitana]